VRDERTFDVILRTPWAGPWRRFQRPSRVIATRDPARVRTALEDVDREVRAGSYAAGFVAYEAASAFDLPAREPASSLPLVCFGIFSPMDVESLGRLPGAAGAATLGDWAPSIDHAAYLRAIASIKERIAAGDTYQINFTFRLLARFTGDPLALMRTVYAGQAGPWSAYIDMGTHAVCSASPELFFKLNDGRLECRPMKGTAPRGYWPDQDAARGEALRASEKNRAENVMIVDMVRNDLGRVAKVGSVRATRLFDVERYPLQWQMTSTVVGEAESRSLVRLFEAMFPSGSVTGAPKHSAMGIIRELESTRRGIYTGAIGYVSPHGRAHFNVAIRTITVDREAGLAEFGVGSGVVWDSVDRDEYDECLLKAKMLGAVVPAASLHVPSYVVDDPPRFRLLESLLWTPEQGFVLLERHLARLAASALCFGFTCDLAEIRATLETAVDDLRGPAKVRLRLEADGSLLCEAVDIQPVPQPLPVALADEPVNRRDVFLYHKTTSRAVYERARAAHPDAGAVILWNEEGEVTEATESNVVIARDGVRVTPPLECGLLPGVLRAELLERGEIVEARITKEELRAAEQVWLINSVRGWMPASLLPPAAGDRGR